MLRCVYTDLDGTLLGMGGSLFRTGGGDFTLLPARALEACYRGGVEVVLKSGRRKTTVMSDARLLGQTSYIYEAGCGVVIDGEETLLTGDFLPVDGKTIYEQIEESGAPRLLLETYAGRLEYHSPWHVQRDISHLMRGLVDVSEVNSLLDENGFKRLRLIDNGVISPKETLLHLDGPPHGYHLIPRDGSKAKAVAFHMRARGYDTSECIAVGDSREDLGVAAVVGRFFLVRNAVDRDPGMAESAPPNVEVTEGANGEGFYEAVVRTLAER